MSNVASLELCKELYELSGCNDVTKSWYLKTESVLAVRCLEAEEAKDWAYSTPAYDLGYLLRKLPATYKGIHFELVRRAEPLVGDVEWFIGYTLGKDVNQSNHQDYVWAEADTPEDACAQLCITLLKQGVLK